MGEKYLNFDDLSLYQGLLIAQESNDADEVIDIKREIAARLKQVDWSISAEDAWMLEQEAKMLARQVAVLRRELRLKNESEGE